MKKILILGIFLLAQCLIISPIAAAPLVQSTFDTNAEGWLVGDLFDGGAGVPTYVASGGNPGGFIRTADQFNWNAYVAPAAFLGDQSAALGGSLDFDSRILTSDGIAYYAVVLEGAGLELGYISSIPTTNWTHFSIPLTGSGWLKNITRSTGNTGDPATAAELQSVLGNLTALRLQADWLTGSDQVDLDNVRLHAIPVPPSVWLVGSSLVGLIGLRRVRKN